jgi:hypothetical protein
MHHGLPSAIELVSGNQDAHAEADHANRNAGETVSPGAGELRKQAVTGGEISP